MICRVIASVLLTCLFASGSFGANADLIVINAKVRTMNERQPVAEAIAVKAGEIIRVGRIAEVRSLASANTRVIDARGRLVLPGFNDAHVHFIAIGNIFSSIDLRRAGSVGDVAARLADYTKFLPKGRWILGGQWNNESWTPAGLLTRDLIDRVTPDHPVFIYHSDIRTAFANSLALQLAGITKDTRDVPGGQINRDASGVPTGILRGAAIDLVKAVVPPAHVSDWEAVAETASNYAASLGVTSVQDMNSDNMAGVYRELERKGKLKTRIYTCGSLARDHMKPIPRSTNGLVRQGCLKGLADGEGDPRLGSNVIDADKAGWQVMIHAIGPKAIDASLSAFERAAARNGKRDRRFRIEHAHNARKEDLGRFKRVAVIASVQPYLFNGGTGKNYRVLLDAGNVLALGSDAPMTDLNPMLGIQAAVAANGNGDAPLSVSEAVSAYTVGSAYGEFQEHRKGTLEPGKVADFVIMSDDIFNIAPSKIGKTSVWMTIIDGKVVFERK